MTGISTLLADERWLRQSLVREPCAACTALVYIDDATSRLMQLRFVKLESTFTYFETIRGYLGKHGKPLALYSDKSADALSKEIC